MNDLLRLIGKGKKEKILSHPNFRKGIEELVRQGYVIVENENFLLTPKGELAKKAGIQPEMDREDEAQARRNELNKKFTEQTHQPSYKDPKSIFFVMLAFFIFLVKLLPLRKSKNKFKNKPNK